MSGPVFMSDAAADVLVYDRSISANGTLRNGLVIAPAAAGVNVMREFLFRNLTPGVPGFQNGKP